MSFATNRITEFEYTSDGQLSKLIARNAVTGDQVTRWHYGTTLEDSGVASNSLLRAKVYSESDDAGPGLNGPDSVYDRVEYRYNRQGELIEQKDQNGTVHAYDYDRLGRLVHDRVTALGTGIDGAVRRISRSFDRAGRVESVSSWNDAPVGGGIVINQVQRRYNGFGQLTQEYQSHEGMVSTGSTPVVRYTYADGSDRHIRKQRTTYPGGYVSIYDYGEPGEADDKLGRVREIREIVAFGETVGEYESISVGHVFDLNHLEDEPPLTIGSVLFIGVQQVTVTALGEKVSLPGPDYDYSQEVTVAETLMDEPDPGSVALVSVPIARYTRRGLSATMRIEYPRCGEDTPLEMTYIKQPGESNGPAGDQYTGQDRFNRNIDIRWLRGGSDPLEHVDRIQYGFDRVSNRLWRKNVVAEEDWDELYSYDGLYQLPKRLRGTLNGTNTGLAATALDDEQFTYDPTGNWDKYLTKASGSTTLDQSRAHNRANETTEIDSSDANVVYDKMGNMTRMPKVSDWETGQSLTWDAWNRLVKVEEGETVVGVYAYDGFARRVWKQNIEAEALVKRHFYYSDRWQALEERVGANGAANRRFVWGLRYIDDLIFRDRTVSVSTMERLYATHDQWHVISTVDDEGDATERFAYRAFGDMAFLAPNFSPRAESESEWEITYGAYRYDPESKLYNVRYRYLNSSIGRWLSRDPLGEADRPNLYEFVVNAPTNSMDPMGLQHKHNQKVGGSFDPGRFNCAAWAFCTTDAWYQPIGKQTPEEMMKAANCEPSTEDAKCLKGSNKVVLFTWNDPKTNEAQIHLAVQNSNGEWSHKCGKGWPVWTDNPQKGLADCYGYNTPNLKSSYWCCKCPIDKIDKENLKPYEKPAIDPPKDPQQPGKTPLPPPPPTPPK